MKPTRTKQITGIIVGSLLLVVSPVVAFWIHISGMLRAFDTLNDTGISDPGRLQSDVHTMLYAGVGGLAGAVIGLIILIISLVYLVRADRAISAGPKP